MESISLIVAWVMADLEADIKRRSRLLKERKREVIPCLKCGKDFATENRKTNRICKRCQQQNEQWLRSHDEAAAQPFIDE